jgi:hypothetical protein
VVHEWEKEGSIGGNHPATKQRKRSSGQLQSQWEKKSRDKRMPAREDAKSDFPDAATASEQPIVYRYSEIKS